MKVKRELQRVVVPTVLYGADKWGMREQEYKKDECICDERILRDSRIDVIGYDQYI